MKRLTQISYLLVLLTIASIPIAKASQCSAVFAGGLSSNSDDGEIIFDQHAAIYDNPTNELAAVNVNSSASAASCYPQQCVASGTSGANMPLNYFNFTDSNSKLKVKTNQTGIMGVAENEYKSIKVEAGAALNVSGNNDYYVIDEMVLGVYSLTNIPPGDYWINKFKMEYGARIVISAVGTTRFYFNQEAVIGVNAQFNTTYAYNRYHPLRVAIMAMDDLKLEMNSHLVGHIYVKDQLTQGQGAIIRGAVSAGTAKLETNAQIYYIDDQLEQSDFNGFCTDSALDHFEIVHDGAGASCRGESVTIKACSNADCSSVYTGSVSVDLLGNGATLASSGHFEQSTKLWFNHGVDESLNLSLANESEAAANPVVCDDGSGNSCALAISSHSCPVAGSCEAVFPSALNNSAATGKVKFEDSGFVSDNDDVYLTTDLVEHNGSEVFSCVEDDCRPLNTLASTMTGSYSSYSSNSNFDVNGETKTIAGDNYKDVKVKNAGVLNMNSGISSYRFRKLKVESGSVLNLLAGDYYLEELEIKGTSTVNVLGDGSARIWVSDKAKFKETSTVNAGASGNPAKLFVYFYGNDEDKLTIEGGASVAAYLYSAQKIEIKGASKFYGAATAEGELKVKDSAEVVRKTTTLDDADFAGACGAVVSALDHYRYEYDGSALTCASESVLIKACANADCSELYDQTTDLGFAVTADGSTISTSLSFTGSMNVDVAESSEQTLSMSLNTSSPSGSLLCYQNGSLDQDCNYDVKDTGFIFIDSDSGEQQIGTQISGKSSNEGADPINIALQAVQADTTTGACVPLFSDPAGVEVELSQQCVDPGSCIVNNGDQNRLKLSNNGEVYALSHYPTHAEHTLLFDSESKAALSINYPDAGKIKLHAQMSIVLSDDETTVISGSSNEFVVRPFALSMEVEDYMAATDNAGAAYKMAGEPFGLTVKALQWQAEDDCDLDGFADVDALCGGSRQSAVLTDNGVTLNFGQEASKEGVIASSVIKSPTFGDDPGLEGGNLNRFDSGVDSVEVNWNNVGIIDINGSLNEDGLYLGTTGLTTTVPGVGRFVPSHFKLNSGAVSQGCGNFSYMGQELRLAFEVEALGVGDISLSNYDSSSEADPLSDKDYHGFAAIGLVAENGNDGVDLGARFDSFSYRWVDGVLTGSYLLDFARVSIDDVPTVDGPYEQVDLGLVLDDGDSVDIDFSSDDLNMNALTRGDCATFGTCTAAMINTSAIGFKFGRLRTTHAYGPQAVDLSLPLIAQYWDGSRFATSVDDSCSTLRVDELTISAQTSSPLESTYTVYEPNNNRQAGTTSVIPSVNTSDTLLSAIDGKFDLSFSAPDVIGIVPVAIDISAYPWLQYDWSSNGTGEVETYLPAKNVSFGQYRGNLRIISWRELR